MKNYNEIAQNIFERRDEYLAKQKAKSKKLIQLSTAVGCFVLVIGIGFGMNMDELVGGQRVEPTEQGDGLYATTSPASDITENLTTTAPLTETSAPTTEDIAPTTDPITQALNTTAPITYPVTTTVPPELYHEIDWNYKSTPGKFRAVVLDSAKYGDVTIKSNKYSDFNEYVYPFGATEEQSTTRKATEFISDMPIEVWDNNGNTHRTTIDIFTLEGLSENLAIGVRFPDDERIYTYINTCYIPETLGEFLEAIDYDNTVSYGGITLFPDNKYPVNDENATDIKNYLLSDATLVNIQDIAVTGQSVTASIYCRELGIENKGFNICEDGYIFTNIIGYDYIFYVGKEAVANFLKDSYNITFEQIKEVTMVTMSTTQPLATTTSSHEPFDSNTSVAVGTTNDAWWCGTTN